METLIILIAVMVLIPYRMKKENDQHRDKFKVY